MRPQRVEARGVGIASDTVLRHGRCLSEKICDALLYLYLNVALPSGGPTNRTGFLRGNASTQLSGNKLKLTAHCRATRRENGVWHEGLFRTRIRAWLLRSTDSGVTLYSTDSLGRVTLASLTRSECKRRRLLGIGERLKHLINCNVIFRHLSTISVLPTTRVNFSKEFCKSPSQDLCAKHSSKSKSGASQGLRSHTIYTTSGSPIFRFWNVLCVLTS